ncbi:hypothetical protein HHK36_027061 [Tetracentron sinense]|uniref:Serine-threonine/tyrosine-protein kinase catalytic domain-containing protein n=1 Tax=Tetracentron sinense TaxID=13715 RepID=A0A834YG72_TETSI|nr:hypothetical protein HHK36_027061 [Tetracentron sinense]
MRIVPSHLENTKLKALSETTNKKDDANKDGTITRKVFTFHELASATQNFRKENLLKSYQILLSNNLSHCDQLVAVKQLDKDGLHGNRAFLVEVLMLSLLHHPNLVNLIGYCADGDQRLLVLFHAAYDSFDLSIIMTKYIHAMFVFADISPEQKPLGWFTRMKIAAGVAKDVYSFGVVLLELITGRRAIDITRPKEEQNLVSWTLQMLSYELYGHARTSPVQAKLMFKDPNKFPEMADPLLQGNFPMRHLNQALAVAALCLQEEATARPLMSDVATTLSFVSVVSDEGTSASAPSQHSDEKMSSDNEDHLDANKV